MDIRSSIIRSILRHFLKDFSTVEYSISANTNKSFKKKYWIFRLKVSYEGNDILGIGCSRNWVEAILKSCSELAEEIVRLENGFETRNGMAGGLTKGNAKIRAIQELVERDAFFYHWNNSIPFFALKNDNQSVFDHTNKFQLSSLQINNLIFTTVLLWQPTFKIDENEVLLFSTATSSKIDKSLNKAYEEISWGGPFLIKRNQSIQFKKSTDPLDLCIKGLSNKEIISKWKSLAIPTSQTKIILRRTKNLPTVKYYQGPLKNIIVAKADHPETIGLTWKEFGNGTGQNHPPHPFW